MTVLSKLYHCVLFHQDCGDLVKERYKETRHPGGVGHTLHEVTTMDEKG